MEPSRGSALTNKNKEHNKRNSYICQIFFSVKEMSYPIVLLLFYFSVHCLFLFGLVCLFAHSFDFFLYFIMVYSSYTLLYICCLY